MWTLQGPSKMAQVKEQSGTTWMVLEASLLIWARYCCAVLSSCCLPPNTETNMSPRNSDKFEKKTKCNSHLRRVEGRADSQLTHARSSCDWHGIRS